MIFAMGSTASRAVTLNDTPGAIGHYGREVCDTSLALTRVLCGLGEVLDRKLSLLFDDDEARQFYDLELRKTELISEIEKWARKQRAKYQVARSRISDPYSSFDAKIAAAQQVFSDCDLGETIDGLMNKLNRLRNDYTYFGIRLESKYGNKSKAKLAKGVISLGCAIVFSALIIGYFHPGLQFARAPGHLFLVSSLTIGCGTAAALALSKDEFQRTQDYLENVEAHLKSLRNSLKKKELGKGTDEADYPEKSVKNLGCIVEHCDNLIKLADEA